MASCTRPLLRKMLNIARSRAALSCGASETCSETLRDRREESSVSKASFSRSEPTARFKAT